MKKHLYLFLSLILGVVFASCSDNDDVIKTYQVGVQLQLPADVQTDMEGVAITLTDAAGQAYQETTDANGLATFTVPAGIYEAASNFRIAQDGYSIVFNGISSGVVVNEQWTAGKTVTLEMLESKTGQLLIKEIYIGGCLQNDGKTGWTRDKYVIIYNNSDQEANVHNLCIGVLAPANAHASINDYDENGRLNYEGEDFLPVGAAGYWYFPGDLSIEPWGQVVVALFQAIDHTATYSNSVDLSDSNYYVMYDVADFDNVNYYPAPSQNIPTNHYLNAVKYGMGNAWVIGDFSPAMVLFTLDDPESYGQNVSNYYYYAGKDNNQVYLCVKVPKANILDGVEVFSEPNKDASKKRITADVDGGYSLLTNKTGHSNYRAVDKSATEALVENVGKIVYGSTEDASGIDAEASIKNGAHIVYQDTNNSTNDFYQRSQASLRK
jgi:hypothetical protein